ncbi:MAG TPA: hypothetical protein VMV24_02600 [Candidatus Dormibacteraeota bacterium]|nr:hypothetical protein [Candidatus Dormibacteraeota bacterium]
MQKQRSGFAVIELIIILVVLIAITSTGYYIWHKSKTTPSIKTAKITSSTAATNTAALNYQSPPTTTVTAPQVSTSSDLNSAMQSLNQASISSNNTDNSQLSTQASGF